MARSTYIWVVQDVDGNIHGCFTVKHEAATYLTKRLVFATLDKMEVHRYNDGRPEGKCPEWQSATEFLA